MEEKLLGGTHSLSKTRVIYSHQDASDQLFIFSPGHESPDCPESPASLKSGTGAGTGAGTIISKVFMNETVSTNRMEQLVALCKRRGFIFQSSELYGGLNGFWDYGPLGTELKRNLKDAWWKDMIQLTAMGPNQQPVELVGLDSSIIMNPKVWVASGHVAGFNDPMVDCKETKNRYRADHLLCAEFIGIKAGQQRPLGWLAVLQGDNPESVWSKRADKLVKKLGADSYLPPTHLHSYMQLSKEAQQHTIGPHAETPGTLTEPRQFNLMFKTSIGALEDPSAVAYLRPETAQGIFVQFRNVLDTTRVKIPFGIAQIGKAFRNEVTPRNFTFRSREFEQMEIEFFVHPKEANAWYEYWRQRRYQWWQSIGISSENLRLREQDKDELAHYAKEGAGSSDIEYRFPFSAPDFGELEGIAHRTDYDLRQHAEYSGTGDKLKYIDHETGERYFPHIIEPSAGVDRGLLALLCDAYVEDSSRPSGVFLRFHPRIAPIKAAVFPLVDRDGMPEIARQLYVDLRRRWNIQLDVKQNIGKRYARMDEVGTPFCFTIDTQTLSDQTVTVRNRDTTQQSRLSLSQVEQFIADKIESINAQK